MISPPRDAQKRRDPQSLASRFTACREANRHAVSIGDDGLHHVVYVGLSRNNAAYVRSTSCLPSRAQKSELSSTASGS